MSDLPTKQVDHPAHNVPKATYHYSGDANQPMEQPKYISVGESGTSNENYNSYLKDGLSKDDATYNTLRGNKMFDSNYDPSKVPSM